MHAIFDQFVKQLVQEAVAPACAVNTEAEHVPSPEAEAEVVQRLAEVAALGRGEGVEVRVASPTRTGRILAPTWGWQ